MDNKRPRPKGILFKLQYQMVKFQMWMNCAGRLPSYESHWRSSWIELAEKVKCNAKCPSDSRNRFLRNQRL